MDSTHFIEESNDKEYISYFDKVKSCIAAYNQENNFYDEQNICTLYEALGNISEYNNSLKGVSTIANQMSENFLSESLFTKTKEKEDGQDENQNEYDYIMNEKDYKEKIQKKEIEIFFAIPYYSSFRKSGLFLSELFPFGLVIINSYRNRNVNSEALEIGQDNENKCLGNFRGILEDNDTKSINEYDYIKMGNIIKSKIGIFLKIL